MNNKITTIIPTLSNQDGLKYLVDFLVNSPLIIIDNQPSSEKKKFCQRKLLTYLPQNKNLGFAAAINLGAKDIHTPWILILNDDIEFLAKNTLQKLIKTADQNNWTAISPVLEKPSGETENLGYTVLPQGKIKLNYNSHLKDLDGITAACLLIKTDVFRSLNGFDERFFAYLEDVDLFMRLKNKGYSFGIAQDIKVIHNHMTTSSKMGNFKAKMDLRNWWFLIIKNWPKKKIENYRKSIFLERLKNLKGYLKATRKSKGIKIIYIVPSEILTITIDIIKFLLNK
jgi:GT2 family glycosyltransferase